MYRVKVLPKVDKKFAKLFRKNRALYEILMRKLDEILIDPHHYKNLRAPMQDKKRVRIGGNHVLVFKIDEGNKVIILTAFKHHNKAYKN